ncbi:hypothetical protein Pmar_PMAR013757 [Perkinsus marinus ATCC 50983]|uniref:Uncharacterized protein n=1 Tax=Perkinsus marinus (strain ATCC 50983 / TXsc) TaxID=423536 RepID=C5LY78_PERM5|nr:hypothetical protein Pmar_PMAR013757 [Perkinsus marinus ATCC 50983]EEQ98408.1 hypothetical protein Pmar_PMAR013757 [Perkinsus marinus ATCC 50983]|eukprot:XP_002765691.1 hypothetical protein Pmar_PMAR013757 [Perkinsus marinus ATCC 50983]
MTTVRMAKPVDSPSASHPMRQGSCKTAVVTVETRDDRVSTAVGSISFDWATPHHLVVDDCRITLSGPFRVTVQDKSDLSRARVDPHFAQWVETGIRSIDIDICEGPEDFFDGLHSFLVYAGGRYRVPWDSCGSVGSNLFDHLCDALDTVFLQIADKAACCVFKWVDRVAEAFGADDPNAIAVPSSPVWSVGTDTKQEVGTTTSSSSTFGTQCGDDEEDVVLVERRESTPTLADSEFWQDCAMPEALIISNAVISDEREGADGTPDTTSSEAKDDVRDVVARVIGVGLMGAPMEVATGGEDFDGVMVECDTISEFCEVGSEDCHTDGDSDCESWVAL